MRRRDPDRVVKDVGRRVSELRAERGWTQAEFAEVMGIAVGHLKKIELGELNMTIRSLARLADHLEVEVGNLFDAPRTREVKRGRPPGTGARPRG